MCTYIFCIKTINLEPFDNDSEFIDIHADNKPSHSNSDAAFPINKNSELLTSSEENFEEITTADYEISATAAQVESVDILPQIVTETSWELIQQNDNSQKLLTHLAIKAHVMPVMQIEKITALHYRDDQVRVVMHNVTQLTEDDVQQRGSVGTGMSGTLYDEDINEKMYAIE